MKYEVGGIDPLPSEKTAFKIPSLTRVKSYKSYKIHKGHDISIIFIYFNLFSMKY